MVYPYHRCLMSVGLSPHHGSLIWNGCGAAFLTRFHREESLGGNLVWKFWLFMNKFRGLESTSQELILCGWSFGALVASVQASQLQLGQCSWTSRSKWAPQRFVSCL